jgi:putative restriction endonuclease
MLADTAGRSWYESHMPPADEEIRARIFSWLDQQVAIYGDQIPWQVLQSFELDGKRAALVTQRGIRWLPGMPALAFTTTYSANPAKAPYADHVGLDGLPRYKYQGTDPSKADNVAMKLAADAGVRLVWFVGTAEASTKPFIPSLSTHRTMPNLNSQSSWTTSSARSPRTIGWIP